MASSPETAPSRGNPPPDSSNSTPPPPTPAPPDNNSTPPPASVPPPPAASSPPPPTPTPSPPQQPPPASTPPPSTPSTTPSPPTAVPPPPAQSQPPPANNTPTTPAVPPPPSTPNTPPAPATAQPPPAAPGSPPAPVVSPTPPGVVPSQTPPSVPGLSPPGLVPAGSGSANRTPTSVTPPPSSSSSNGGGGISTGIIVAIAFGGVVIIAVLVVCLIFSKRKKKPQYYMGHGPPPKGGDQYYNGPPQWNSPQPMEHMVKIPPPPGTMGTPGGGGGGGWGPQPPAHMANTSNSDNSPGYTSGQHPMMQPMQQPLSPNMGGIGSSQSQFSYEDLAAATNGFSQANLLGQGGFGYVHKGVLLGKREVAVKSLKTGSGQGEREFQAEVEIISRVHHRHLVSLVGYCIASDQRMLVYEFVPNKTLEFHLHGKGQPVMDWSSRLRIALGSAKGLAYLHEDCHPRIIHRDIKAANILLDSNFEAMVADFGLAKLTTDNFTHVSTRVMGTFGYLAPEYAASGKLTEKSDVFSFGVMLLELITGRRPVDPTNRTMEDSLVDWARPLMTKALEDGNYEALVDPRLEDNYVPHEMARMVASASATIRHSARRRPRMSQIVRALEGAASLEDLNDNVKSTTKSATSSISTNTATEVYDTRAYDADIMKFRQMVLTNQDTNSSEYGATSEYGLNPSSSSSDSSGEIGKKNPVKQKM